MSTPLPEWRGGGGGQGSGARGSWILKVKPGCEHHHGPCLRPHFPLCDEDWLWQGTVPAPSGVSLGDNNDEGRWDDWAGAQNRERGRGGRPEAEAGCAGKHL